MTLYFLIFLYVWFGLAYIAKCSEPDSPQRLLNLFNLEKLTVMFVGIPMLFIIAERLMFLASKVP